MQGDRYSSSSSANQRISDIIYDDYAEQNLDTPVRDSRTQDPEAILPELYISELYNVEQAVILDPTKGIKLKNRQSFHEVPIVRSTTVEMDNYQKILMNNLDWSENTLKNDPEFFERLKHVQKPQFLWIGCSDSRVPANQIVDMKPGQLFVHRNIANQAALSDINALAVVQYALEVLKVKDIIICGHYGCGGVKAAFKKHDHGILQTWLSFIRDLLARYRKQLKSPDQQANEDLLVQLNVKQQVYNIARVPIVQKIWKEGGQLRVHGLVYNLKDGLLNDLGLTIDTAEHLPEQYKIY